jgi:hypothetical protein
MSKQDRQGVRTPADLERKWQFGKQFTEIMGIANDAREAAYKVESELRNEILEQKTTLERSTEQIIMTALKSYVETGDFEDFKTTLEAEFSVWADGIYAQVKSTSDKMTAENALLQDQLNMIAKYFAFTVNGLEIGATYIDTNGEEKQSPNKVVIDNDEITILAHGNVVQKFDADGNALIPTLKVDKSMNVLGLVWNEDDTHINCSYIGG